MTQLKFLQYGLSCADVGDQVSVSAATSCPWVMSAQAGLCYLCLYLCWPLLPALTPDQARLGGWRSILCCLHLFDFSSFVFSCDSLVFICVFMCFTFLHLCFHVFSLFVFECVLHFSMDHVGSCYLLPALTRDEAMGLYYAASLI